MFDELEKDEVARCIQLLEALNADPERLAALDPEQHRALLIAAGRLSRPTREEQRRVAKLVRKRQRRTRKEHDQRLFERTEIRVAQRSSRWEPPPQRALPPASDLETGPELAEPRSCYVCKTPYRRLHFFYHSMCPSCAVLNYQKRTQTARLDGQVALVTGARLKIGYQAALLLLRAGARVIATTRFPNEAASRYAREPDYASFADRLQLHGLDLRHAPSVELFARFLDETEPRLDHILNNAAQTVRRPPGFYAHLIAEEERALEDQPAEVRPLLAAHARLRRTLEAPAASALPAASGVQGALSANGAVVAWHGGRGAIGLTESARLSQLPCAPGDDLTGDLFPAGLVDLDLQQVDRRTINSWRLPLAEVSTPELLEVHLVNAVAPFILNARLKPLMLRQRTFQKHIVNVSAMEAQFARNKKTDKHPHTNMAKAALNMMTRTSAMDYAKDGIFMNSVDTGWVTDEDPLQHVARKQEVHDFHPPLDALDGAARVCDPIFTHFLSGRPMWGLFLKDYRPTSW
jgi:NAD(P)-dependent dehydrogenase (short-subunit alcohol dehydrogenase family)